MERLSYFLHNQQISAERFYEPLLRYVLVAFARESVLMTLDTSMLWNQFCLVAVCFVWGECSFTLSQMVLEHSSATVGFEQYQSMLQRTKRVLPPQCQVTLLADRGFEHGHLQHWLRQQNWSWAIRVKSDLKVTLADGCNQSVEQLLPPPKQAYLFENVQVLDDIACHLVTANVLDNVFDTKDAWAVLSDQASSLQTLALYGKRFSGIEPHFRGMAPFLAIKYHIV